MSIINQRQSIRVFNSKEVEGKKLQQIVEAGLMAPSSKSKEPWQLIVLDDKKLIDDFSHAHPNWKTLKTANKVIIVCGDLNLDEREKHTVMACSAVTQNILLKCVELDLGAVWLGLYPDEVRTEYTIERLNIPDNILPISLIAIGYYDNKNERNKDLSKDKVHYNNW